jgi:hypothetical protein
MRGHLRFGVCNGTHRLYSLMVLVRLDDEFQLLSPERRDEILDHLRSVRDLIAECQFEDGHWPSNWSRGKSALEEPIDDPLYKQVIATGHHLEWLAIAPVELHPSRAQIQKAADWLIETTRAQSAEEIASSYTYFSHVGNALALWRKTHPGEFWSRYFADRAEPPVEMPTTKQPQEEHHAAERKKPKGLQSLGFRIRRGQSPASVTPGPSFRLLHKEV